MHITVMICTDCFIIWVNENQIWLVCIVLETADPAEETPREQAVVLTMERFTASFLQLTISP